MYSAKKIKLVPSKNQIGEGSYDEDSGVISTVVEEKKDKNKTKIFDKIHRFIKIILKLARSVGYDDELRIKLKNGRYLAKSNIVDLLTHAMSVGRVLYGENEFIELLANSGVDPELIINDNVRTKLYQFKNKNSTTLERTEKIDSPIRMDTIVDEVRAPLKRKRHFYEDEEVISDSNSPEQEHLKKKRRFQEVEKEIDDNLIDPDQWSIPND